MNEFSLLNKNYEKVLDLLSEPFKDKKDLLKRRNKIIDLLGCAELSGKISECYNLIKNDLPNEFLGYNNYRELDILIRSYAKLATDVPSQDHGYTLLILYFLWITRNE